MEVGILKFRNWDINVPMEKVYHHPILRPVVEINKNGRNRESRTCRNQTIFSIRALLLAQLEMTILRKSNVLVCRDLIAVVPHSTCVIEVTSLGA